MAKVTRFEYMEHEFTHAKLLAETLPGVEEREMFRVHAGNLQKRLMDMTPDEGSMLVDDDDGTPEKSVIEPKIIRKIRITLVESFTLETAEHTVNTLRCDDALGGHLARKLALTVGKKDHEFSKVIVKDARK